ncbi:hypothetical protein EV360DRAFT_90591 [Lentinula raphanica]|nr:hypothetical protein EV360DRAFT_90591 [Lentinula raphanica]
MHLNPVFLGPCLALWLSFIACASSAPLPKPMEVIPANEVPMYTYTVKNSNDWFQKTFGSQIEKDAKKYNNAKPKYEKDNSIPQFEFQITVKKHIPGKDGKGGIDVPTTKRMELRAKVADKGNKVFVALNPGPPKLGLYVDTLVTSPSLPAILTFSVSSFQMNSQLSLTSPKLPNQNIS